MPKKFKPFNDIPFLKKQAREEKSRPDLGKFKEMSVGDGSKVLRSDQQGLWQGAAKFADAPFKVDMEGNVTITAADGSAYLKFNSNLTRILVNDGTNDRVLIGKF